jgi:hypothetical protein
MHTTWFFYKVIGWYHFRPGIIYNYLSGYDLAIIPDSHLAKFSHPTLQIILDPVLKNILRPGPDYYYFERKQTIHGFMSHFTLK